MPESLEQLDLLLMQEVRARKVRRDGIHFQSLRYLSLTLAAYVGEEVTIRFDPRDLGEIGGGGTEFWRMEDRLTPPKLLKDGLQQLMLGIREEQLAFHYLTLLKLFP